MDGSEEEVVTDHHGHNLQSGRHRLLGLLKGLFNAGVYFGGIGARCCEYQEEGTRTVLNIRSEVVAHGTNLHLGNVTQVQYAATAGAKHDIVELLNGLQGTLVLHRILVGVLRHFAQRTYSRHEALSANGSKDVVRSQAILSHHVGLQPDAQGIGITQALYVTHAGDTHQTRLEVDIDIV